jgi:hypothetical protein
MWYTRRTRPDLTCPLQRHKRCLRSHQGTWFSWIVLSRHPVDQLSSRGGPARSERRPICLLYSEPWETWLIRRSYADLIIWFGMARLLSTKPSWKADSKLLSTSPVPSMNCTSSRSRGIEATNHLEPFQCVHFGIQGTGSHPTIQGHGQAE